MKFCERLLKRYSYETCSYVGNQLGEYGMKEIVAKDIFGRPKEIEFEGFTTFVPSKAEMYLTNIYGEDWNQIPQIEKRKSIHNWSYLSFTK